MGARSRRDDGFTLVEVLFAMALVAIVAVDLAGLMTLAIRVAHGAREQTLASVLAAQKLEQLRSGTAVSEAAAGSLNTSEPGYSDWLDEAGQSAGIGSPAASAVYVRRWTVGPLTGVSDVVLLRVLVTTVARDARTAAGARTGRGANEALLVTATRRW